MNIYKKELIKNFRGLIIWTLSIAGLLALMISQFKVMGNDVDTSGYSYQFKAAMGIDKVDMNTFLGYYAIKASILVTLFGAIYASFVGSSLIVKDELLLSMPVSRIRIVVERIMAAITNMFIFNMILGVILLSVEQNAKIVWIILGQFMLHIVFVAVGFLSAAIQIKSKAALMFPLGIVLATYVISLIYGLSDKLGLLKYISPFYFSDAKEIIINGSMSIVNVLIMCLGILLCTIIGFIVYTKRDIPC